MLLQIARQTLEHSALKEETAISWAEFLSSLKLDDPEQPVPKPAKLGYLSFIMPAPHGSSWITVYRDVRNKEVGLFLVVLQGVSRRGLAMLAVADDWESVLRGSRWLAGNSRQQGKAKDR